MRAARLLHMLLLLQNRGRLSAGALARELEVSRRTIQRDLDAMTEAGLPIIVHRGREGGIELGFDYRTRLTGLDRDEAEAMALVLTQPLDRLEPFGLADAGARARAKIWEAFPDQTRAVMTRTGQRFAIEAVPGMAHPVPDPRPPALARAIRDQVVVRLRMRGANPQTVHPTRLAGSQAGWHLHDALSRSAIHEDDWGDINISAHRFADPDNPALHD